MTKEEAIEILKSYRKRLTDSVSNQLDKDIEAFEMATEALENQKTGHWIRLHEDYPECDFEFKGCSVCRTHYPNFAVKQFRYCPNCGANMRGE